MRWPFSMVTQRGIEANPLKIKAILEMKASACINEVQRLTGRIAALSRFISKYAEKSLPFEWDTSCQRTFEELRIYLAGFPLLVKPSPGDTLYLYHSTTPQAVSSVLIREEEGRQLPIYYALADFVSEMAGMSAKDAFQDQMWLLQVDGLSTTQGIGAGIVVTSPQGEDLEFAIKFDFKASNNEAEYETLCSRRLQDEDITIQYLPEARALLAVQPITSGEDWRTPVIKWLEEEPLLDNRWEAARLKARAARFLLEGRTLYKRSYTHPLLRCLSTEEGIHVLQEIHNGCCGAHVGTWILANKALRAGYFWPTVKQEARQLVSKLCRFGIPRELISDNGRQFQGRRIQEWRQGLHIKQRFTSVAHPQANGQVEVTNRILVQGIKRRLERVGGNWTEELISVLWAYRTIPRGCIGESPFLLVYEIDAVIPVELGMPYHRVMNFSEECNKDLHKESLNLIEKLREKAFIRIQRYKNTMINSYNKRVRARSFQVGDLVLRRVDTLKPVEKLDPTWKGPYKITGIICRGAYELENLEGRLYQGFGTFTILKSIMHKGIPLKVR
ncbi:UNVERIFIED_CONTAM: hypothetical protein Sradi_3013900 [Sesamum radiatum]|uniref:Integrase catalytic domain-containing protein n=1 Tax=Sesamum radiatum TaxID=300843 RepID=A0AAW2S124_SESRA